MKYLYIYIGFFLLFGCKKSNLTEPLASKINSNLIYFGYTLVDVGWDDPTDKESKTNYLDEIECFSNIADILVVSPNDNIVDRLINMDNSQVKGILHLYEIFFEQTGTGGDKSGFIYELRSDYQDRWDTFHAVNDISNNANLISCFYIGEEPAWNGITESDFTLACDYVKSTITSVPIFLVEAYPSLTELYTPNSVDWVGFDHYFIAKPFTDDIFNKELILLKTKLKTHQKIFLILDAHYIKFAHGSQGINKNEMDIVARDYYNIANADTSIIGLLGYHWPSGFEFKKSIGARDLPKHVKDEHEKIGRIITGK